MKNGMRNGWIEKYELNHVAATLKAEFRLLNPTEARELLAQSCYRQTGLKHLTQLSKDSPLHRAITKDIFQSRLSLLCQNPLAGGERLELLLHLPQYRIPLSLLAGVRGVDTTVEMGRNLFHGALQVFAIHKDDVDRLSRNLTQQQPV